MDDKNRQRNSSRRDFISGFATVATGLSILSANPVYGVTHPVPVLNANAENTWPVFNIHDFGARGNGVFLNTKVIQSAIDQCNRNGGGTVFFPPGVFLTGTLELKTNVNLYLSAGATVFGSADLNDYRFKCLFYARDSKNVSISGRGTVNGNGESFWADLLKQGLSEDELNRRMKRPEWMMQFLRCDNLLLEGITVINSPRWSIHPIDCEGVTITGITILNGVYEKDGPNTDGINPDGCTKVRISNCHLQCGDDCIVLKITDREGGNKYCRDVVVTNCILQSSETALKIGSESNGEFRNIVFSNCTIRDSGCGFGLWMRDGGLIDGVLVSNITMETSGLKNGGQVVYMWTHPRRKGGAFGIVRNINITNVIANGYGGIFISGAKEQYISSLTLDRIRIFVGPGRETDFHQDPPYPFTVWGHQVAPYDIMCRYVEDLKLSDVQLTWAKEEKEEWGSAIRCWYIRDLEISGFSGRQSLHSKSAAIWLKEVKGAYIYNCKAPKGTTAVFQFDEGTTQISLMGNEFSQARKLSLLPINRKELFESGNRLPASNK